MSEATSLTDHFLIAMPAMDDPEFARSVTYICQHGEDGAMGIRINRASEYSLGDVLSHMQLKTERREVADSVVLFGGPVHGERGFVLHDSGERWDSTLVINSELSLTTSRDILEAMSEGRGPQRVLVALGYCGWEAGQLEAEILDNAWLSVPAQHHLLFDLPLEQRWQAAARLLGVDITHLADYAGHA